jgi:hypothetical protein
MITWEKANTYKAPTPEIVNGERCIVTTCYYCLHEVAIPEKMWNENEWMHKKPMHGQCAIDKYL